VSNELVIHTRPKGAVAENIRTLRTNLHFSIITNNVSVLLITSSIPGEGKSFISANLASAFAMSNAKILLIDCDMRKGRQDRIFKVNGKIGLSNLLLDDVNNYKNYIQKTSVENLYLLPGGIVPPNPSELLGTDKTQDLMKLLKKQFDLIILDCPPVNAVSDALVLTSLADEVVIVAAYKQTPIDLLTNTKKTLENSGAKIAGVVLNKTERTKNNRYYNRYYQ